MSDSDTTVRAVKRDGKLYCELPDGSKEEMAICEGRAMSEAEILAAALLDPDNPPLSTLPPGRYRRLPRSWGIRRRLDITQEDFAHRFAIPVETVRDWEAGRSEPDQAMNAYLAVIAKHPDLVAATLAAKAQPSKAAE